jgi:leader peptidase (prepilin peptidase)/N-methyltransferase
MAVYWYIIVFTFGAILGSFLNVVLYRLHTGKSLNGRSHCMSCGKTLTWYELFPIFSYIVQRGRCRGCSAHIPSRYLLVELLTGVSFVITWHLFSTNPILLVLYSILILILILILVYDVRHTIIPDELTLMVCGVAVGFLGYGYAVSKSLTVVWESLLAGLFAGAFLGGLWLVSKGRWIGLGDAKLAFPFGVMVGLSGVFSMMVLSFWIGMVVSLVLLGIERILKKGKTNLHFLATPLTIKSEVPFAPFLIAGFLSVQFLHADIFDITYKVFLSRFLL